MKITMRNGGTPQKLICSIHGLLGISTEEHAFMLKDFFSSNHNNETGCRTDLTPIATTDNINSDALEQLETREMVTFVKIGA